MIDPKPTLVRFPKAPEAPAPYADIVLGEQQLRIVPDDTGQDGFRAYVLRRNDKLGIQEAVEVALPSRGTLIEALTGLTRGWRARVTDDIEELEDVDGGSTL